MDHKSKEYRLINLRTTSGWCNSMNPNHRNSLSMLPIEVAIQAGNLSELVEIASHPDLRAQSLGRAEFYITVGMQVSGSSYPEAEMRICIRRIGIALRERDEAAGGESAAKPAGIATTTST